MFKTKIARIAIVVVLAYAGMGLQCSSNKSDLDKAVSASNELSHDINIAIKATAVAFEKKKISLETKDKIASSLLLMSQKGSIFNQKLKQLSDSEAQGHKVTREEILTLNNDWLQIYSTFTEVWALIRANLHPLSGEEVNKLSKDVATINKVVGEK